MEVESTKNGLNSLEAYGCANKTTRLFNDNQSSIVQTA